MNQTTRIVLYVCVCVLLDKCVLSSLFHNTSLSCWIIFRLQTYIFNYVNIIYFAFTLEVLQRPLHCSTLVVKRCGWSDSLFSRWLCVMWSHFVSSRAQTVNMFGFWYVDCLWNNNLCVFILLKDKTSDAIHVAWEHS